jgi:hypothetical protein
MNGRAYIFTISAIGKGSMMGGISGHAATFGMTKGSGRDTVPTAIGEGERTRESGLMHWLYVTPTEPQEIVWLQPGIDYNIETSTDLKWKIL